MHAAAQQQAAGVAQLQTGIQIGAVLESFGLDIQLPLTDVYVSGPSFKLPLTGSCARRAATSRARGISLP